MSKVVIQGLEDAGKSYLMAVLASDLAWRNHRWLETGKTSVPRPLLPNLAFSDEFHEWCKDLNVPIKYWTDVGEWPKMEEGDMLVDEVPNYLDARKWPDLPLDVRVWIRQASKLGVDMYCTAQDFGLVDKTFRMLTNHLIDVTKVCGNGRPSKTKPSTERIWGLGIKHDLNPKEYDTTTGTFKSGSIFSYRPFFFRKQYTSIFDTNKRIADSALPPLKHIHRICPDCGITKLTHV